MTAKGQLTDLRQYIEDFEVGLTMRLDDLGARLQAIESNITLLGTRLVADVRSETDAKETSPDDSGL
ncbi:MAG: hypothetical protein OXC69_00065 [Candidatus Tectomicrobia bacterium]|nr:hypothetical protein [Candidatus Tectomicrobia bacterium]